MSILENNKYFTLNENLYDLENDNILLIQGQEKIKIRKYIN